MGLKEPECDGVEWVELALDSIVATGCDQQ
jgi:hypothetical protein